jgi:hypothetical protein
MPSRSSEEYVKLLICRVLYQAFYIGKVHGVRLLDHYCAYTDFQLDEQLEVIAAKRHIEELRNEPPR